jgi:hypothetical protein
MATLLLSSTRKRLEFGRVSKRYEEVNDGRQHTDASKNINPSSSSDFAALIDAIKTEGRAIREDDAKAWREWLNIILLSSTLFAISWQVYEMIKVPPRCLTWVVTSGSTSQSAFPGSAERRFHVPA